MPKRRRERDRPKAGPDAGWHPSKRVLLSYAEEEEEEEVQAKGAVGGKEGKDAVGGEKKSVVGGEARDAAGKEVAGGIIGLEGRALIPERELVEYQFDEYPDDAGEDVEAEVEADGEGDGEAEDGHDGEEEVQAVDNARQAPRNIRKNLSTNQRPVLGSLAYQYDDEDEAAWREEDEYDAETESAMAYLRAVRAERQGIPSVLSAAEATQPEHKASVEQPLGYFEDGVYSLRSTSNSTRDDPTSPRTAYTTSLVSRFRAHGAALHQPPTLDSLAKLPPSHPISFPAANNKAYAEWLHHLRDLPPLPAQLRSLDQGTVFRLLELLRLRCLPKGQSIGRATSAWLWGLLARLGEVGQMSNEEVYGVREVGKRAVFLLLAATDPSLASGVEALAKEEGSGEIDLEADLRGLDAVEESSEEREKIAAAVDEHTLATLDMVLVVVGEVFGQRDLLEHRRAWEKDA